MSSLVDMQFFIRQIDPACRAVRPQNKQQQKKKHIFYSTGIAMMSFSWVLLCPNIRSMSAWANCPLPFLNSPPDQQHRFFTWVGQTSPGLTLWCYSCLFALSSPPRPLPGASDTREAHKHYRQALTPPTRATLIQPSAAVSNLTHGREKTVLHLPLIQGGICWYLCGCKLHMVSIR